MQNCVYLSLRAKGSCRWAQLWVSFRNICIPDLFPWGTGALCGTEEPTALLGLPNALGNKGKLEMAPLPVHAMPDGRANGLIWLWNEGMWCNNEKRWDASNLKINILMSFKINLLQIMLWFEESLCGSVIIHSDRSAKTSIHVAPEETLRFLLEKV